MRNRIILTAALSLLLPAALGAQHWSLTWKNFQTRSPELECIGRIQTKTSARLANPQWSVGCETLDREYAEFSAYKAYLGELGVGSARLQSGWARCEKEKGVYDFGWLDEAVDGLIEEGVSPWVCLCYGNPVYGASKGLGSEIFTDKTTKKAWIEYVAATVERYKGKVIAWEIWNEPNLGENAKKPEAYAELLTITAKKIKGIDPDAEIIGFGLSRMPVDYARKVLEILKKNNAEGLLDYVSFHPYYENPDDARDGINELTELVKSYCPDVKMLQGECGCPSTLEWGHALRYREWSEYSQAKWDLRRMANDYATGTRSSIFTIVDLQYPNMLQSFGLLRTNLLKEVVYARPSYHGVRNMVNLLTKETSSEGFLTHSENTAREISVVGIKGEGDRTIGAMYWYSDKIPDSELKWDSVELKIEGLSIADPVLVEPITGRVFELRLPHGSLTIDGMKLSELPVWDSPMIIMDRKAVPEGSIFTEKQAGGNTKDMLF